MSTLRTFTFNVFLNDPLFKLGCLENCALENYGNDITVGMGGNTPARVVKFLVD